MTYRCERCIYFDDCPSSSACEYFTPAFEEDEDAIAENELLEQKEEFVEQYYRYIDGWN